MILKDARQDMDTLTKGTSSIQVTGTTMKLDMVRVQKSQVITDFKT